MLQIKRVYDKPTKDDGMRVLVDRLWPRGVSHEEAALDLWLKEIAPSPELREWFGHKPERFEEFTQRYHHELAENPAVDTLRALVKDKPRVTLLFGAKDPQVNHAVVLRDYLTHKAGKA